MENKIRKIIREQIKKLNETYNRGPVSIDGKEVDVDSIEMDGDLNYNPSTGTLSATHFSGTSTLATVATKTSPQLPKDQSPGSRVTVDALTASPYPVHVEAL